SSSLPASPSSRCASCAVARSSSRGQLATDVRHFARRQMKNSQEWLKNGSIQALLLMNALLMLYPLFVMVLSAFKTNAEIFSSPFALPKSFAFTNLEKVWEQTTFIRYML